MIAYINGTAINKHTVQLTLRDAFYQLRAKPPEAIFRPFAADFSPLSESNLGMASEVV